MIQKCASLIFQLAKRIEKMGSLLMYIAHKRKAHDLFIYFKKSRFLLKNSFLYEKNHFISANFNRDAEIPQYSIHLASPLFPIANIVLYTLTKSIIFYVFCTL
jgi:hypothetical protein